ncbi:MAG: aspartate--tRNA(Asn) ligase, partial [Chloroflexi bacterium]|nr:aspartate--tRNA(Asn) ligase [Chloroflexota bacterium]
MQRTTVHDLRAHLGAEIKIQGWVKTIRDQKTVQFVIVQDTTGMVQVTLARSEANAPLNQQISSLTLESTVEVVGTAVENPKVSLGGVEVLLRGLRVTSAAESPLPIDLSGRTETALDKRLDWRFLDLRRPENLLIFRVQTTIEMAMRRFWLAEGFIEM